MAKAGYGKRRMKSQHNKQWNKTVKGLKESAKPFKQAARVGKKTYRKMNRKKNGCYIATCVYGSYDCPEVWTLRRYRDYSLSETHWGRVFVRIYYALSPTVVRLFGRTTWFHSLFKSILDKKVNHLNSKGYDNTPYSDSN